MAKKFGKFLAFTAIASGLVVGGIAIYKKFIECNEDFDDYDDYDYDDEDDMDEDEPLTCKREYVPITLEAPKKEDECGCGCEDECACTDECECESEKEDECECEAVETEGEEA